MLRRLYLIVVAGVACSHSTPSRIVASSDTVVVNTTMLEPVEAHVLNRKGAVIHGAPIDYTTTASDSILAVRDGRAVQCRNDGAAPVTLSSGGIKSTVIVRCEIIEKLEAEPFVCMRLGGPAVPLSVTGMDKNGNPIPAPRVYLRTDSSFVRVMNGLVYPLKAGDGDLWYTNGRRRAFTLIRVLDTVAVGKSKARLIHARDKMFAPVCAQLPLKESTN